ncbi:hypothetical protein KJ359_012751 [Pestalotiopsis sp. 9143b]|nr:hypothetical protein KJ359_012751 [Pestalotiopsis sp. 9143b]
MRMRTFQVLALYAVGGTWARDHVVADLDKDFGAVAAEDLLSGGGLDLKLDHDHDRDEYGHGGGLEGHDTASQEPEAYDEDAAAEAARLWPISTPCARNGTREYCVYSNPGFASGRGISIITSASRAASIAKSAAFSSSSSTADDEDSPLNDAAANPPWRVDDVPGKGKGLTATRNLELGDHIMSTTASVMIDYNVFYDVTLTEELQDLQVAAVGALPEDHRDGVFMGLSTHDGAADHAERVSKIILTNSFDIQISGVVAKRHDEDEENFYTVFPEISRMNHDCRPNADYYFDPATLAQHIHASRPIAAGEEITISYIDAVQTKQDRLDRLDHSWHFPCSCSACTQNKHMTAASDARIQQIHEIRKQLREWEPGSQATPALAELLVSLYDQERLWTMLYEAYTYAAIEHNGVGEPWTASRYARLAIQRGLASGGPGHSDVAEMEALARDPWGHWSWMLRMKKRMNWQPHAPV